jgi:hypothetical protein
MAEGDDFKKEDSNIGFKHSSTLNNNKVSCMDLDKIADKKKQVLKK